MARHSCRGRAWDSFRLSVLNAVGWRCERCGGTGRLEVHHRVPLAKGGKRFDRGNLEVVCRRCHFEEHRSETDRERDAWKELVYGET